MKGPQAGDSGGLALFAVVVAIALSACGSAKAPSVATLGATTSSGAADSTNTAGDDSGSGSPPSQAQQQTSALRFAQCMRSKGVPSFPDPAPGGGFAFHTSAGFDPTSPAIQAAQAKCQKFMPTGAGLAPGTTTHPSTGWLAHMVKVAQCMRGHGVPNFPDPTTTIPPFRPGIVMISDIDGVILVFPSTIDTQSPTFRRAADACGMPQHHH
jgi:hypothetical protein